jgi:hypothetical protein
VGERFSDSLIPCRSVCVCACAWLGGGGSASMAIRAYVKTCMTTRDGVTLVLMWWVKLQPLLEVYKSSCTKHDKDGGLYSHLP